MISDWPTAAVVLGTLAACVVMLRSALPYFVGRSTAEAQRAALKEVNDRIAAVEAHLISGQRKFPGRLG